MKSRWQALQSCLDTAVIVVVKVFNKFFFEMLHRLKFLQIKQLGFEQAKEIFNNSVVQTIPFPAHALADTLLFEHSLEAFVLVLPALV